MQPCDCGFPVLLRPTVRLCMIRVFHQFIDTEEAAESFEAIIHELWSAIP